jgi:glycosyltransferase involved in cell wall biosynthesis
MRLCIASGIYPPEIGGPSVYVQKLKDALEREGHSTVLVLYGGLKRFPTGVRHLLYTLKLLRYSRGCDAILAFDTFSVALPAAFVRVLTGRQTIVRAGGDFLWERYVERTHELIPLPKLYARSEKWSQREWLTYGLLRFAFRRVTMVFSSEWQRRMWILPYGLMYKDTHVVENATEPAIDGAEALRKNYLFFSRDIVLKNRHAFRKAFQKAKEKYPGIILEEGMLPHAELIEKIRTGYAVVVPSISDITPNVILESMRCGKPFLLTKFSGYAEAYADCGAIVDPESIEDMQRGIEELADDAVYTRYMNAIRRRYTTRTYEDLAREFIDIVKGTSSYSPRR